MTVNLADSICCGVFPRFADILGHLVGYGKSAATRPREDLRNVWKNIDTCHIHGADLAHHGLCSDDAGERTGHRIA
jgi:hypothetical protein